VGLQEALSKICLGCYGGVRQSGGENFQITDQRLEESGMKVSLKTMPTSAIFSLMAGLQDTRLLFGGAS
jgi:hypothetical protein